MDRSHANLLCHVDVTFEIIDEQAGLRFEGIA
jgi:hypothetical protein